MSTLPTVYEIQSEDVLAARRAIENGIEYLRMCLGEHEQKLGRTTLKNKHWGEQMDSDLSEMLGILTRLPRVDTQPNCIVRNASGQGTHLEYRHPLSLDGAA